MQITQNVNIPLPLPQDLVSGSERNQMSKPFQRDALAVVDVLRDDFFQAAKLHRLFHRGLRLFALILREIIKRSDPLTRGTRSFPAAEGLIPGPSTGCGSLWPINIGHSRFDVIQEIGHILFVPIATCS